ncbi:hypothetical protein HN670_02755 [bacterium]|jgi:PHD/YefM family antitoxin component YafN of YafNO toxin-antitoxin module|nr:hypothetical protein [bacterium]
MYQKLDKVLKLVAKTGDKIVVVSENHDPYVVMSLTDYDRLITGSSAVNELTEEQLLGKLNRDIAVWKSAQEVEEMPKNTDEYDLNQFKVEDTPDNTTETEEDKPSEDEGTVEEEDKYYIEPVE